LIKQNRKWLNLQVLRESGLSQEREISAKRANCPERGAMLRAGVAADFCRDLSAGYPNSQPVGIIQPLGLKPSALFRQH
jgi:hypothetical protein